MISRLRKQTIALLTLYKSVNHNLTYQKKDYGYQMRLECIRTLLHYLIGE